MKPTQLVTANAVCLLVVIVLGLLVNANGEILSLSEAISTVIAAVVFVVAFALAGMLIGKTHGPARWLGVVLMVVYVIMLLPVLG